MLTRPGCITSNAGYQPYSLVFPVGRCFSLECFPSGGVGYPSHSLFVAMANPNLPICNSPESIDISTPPSSERSRSERIGNAPVSGAVALMPQHSGFSHRGVMPTAPREGGPNVDVPMSSDARVFNQVNVNHDQGV